MIRGNSKSGSRFATLVNPMFELETNQVENVDEENNFNERDIVWETSSKTHNTTALKKNVCPNKQNKDIVFITIGELNNHRENNRINTRIHLELLN